MMMGSRLIARKINEAILILGGSRRGALAASLGLSLALGSCSGFGLRNAPINTALINGEAPSETNLATPGKLQDVSETAIGLSFSGGGTRASAFAFGVLQELARTD